jgi:hydroxyacyl-ACP dehydratase HTD2-like protein with hotdog domain
MGAALGEMALLSSDLSFGGPVVIRFRSKAALSLCMDCKEGQRVEHTDIIHHFDRDHVASGELSFVYCMSVVTHDRHAIDKSSQLVSNCLTKASTRPLF